MRDGRVERIEVVVGRLYLRALDDAEPKADEHVDDLARRLRDQMKAPQPGQRIRRQRDIDPLPPKTPLQLLCGQLPRPTLDRQFQVRQLFQETMEADLCAAVERLTSRQVVAFISGNRVDPDISAEVFILDAPL